MPIPELAEMAWPDRMMAQFPCFFCAIVSLPRNQVTVHIAILRKFDYPV
jgi:hypothetical protein